MYSRRSGTFCALRSRSSASIIRFGNLYTERASSMRSLTTSLSDCRPVSFMRCSIQPRISTGQRRLMLASSMVLGVRAMTKLILNHVAKVNPELRPHDRNCYGRWSRGCYARCHSGLTSNVALGIAQSVALAVALGVDQVLGMPGPMVEFPAEGHRIFIEAEAGTQTL